MPKKVLVTGCYDLLHSGHIAFFQQAASYGELYVAVGSDGTVREIKGRAPVNNEQERLYMVQSVGCVTGAFISHGSGILDFVDEMKALQPDLLVVNEDGNIPAKQELCESLGVQYVVLKREPYPGLAARSSTALRRLQTMPFRIDLCGGWLDQPWVSRFHPGPVLTISLEPTVEFNERSGMASSTRRTAIDLWGPRLPAGDPEKLAYILFCCDNPPGKTEISGSQDAIGLVFPGLNRAYYQGEYWPIHIDSIHDEAVLRFIEDTLYLIPLGPREAGFSVLNDTLINQHDAKALAEAAEQCWSAMLGRDLAGFGQAMRAGFDAQIAMFPNMVVPSITRLIARFRDEALGWKVSGAGGGGYLILVADRPVANALRILIRRRDEV